MQMNRKDYYLSIHVRGYWVVTGVWGVSLIISSTSRFLLKDCEHELWVLWYIHNMAYKSSHVLYGLSLDVRALAITVLCQFQKIKLLESGNKMFMD